MRNPVRVLIADDHQVVREGLQMILAESDGEIVVVGEASDGDEAVRLATAV
jgi:YesN/AraC family two-component response regulator